MEGLLWLLAFAAFFYLMMRYGCGAHMVHGHHGGSEGNTGAGAGGTDPVCGMAVEPDSGYTMAHAGARYWFCSRRCLETFEADPEKCREK